MRFFAYCCSRRTLHNLIQITIFCCHSVSFTAVGVGSTSAMQQADGFLYGTFPIGFKWGLSTSAYQVEGSWNEDGRTPSIWDNFTHKIPSPVKDGETGDTSCDSYHKFKDDVQMLKSLGANHYRFSLSWSRILPLGTNEVVNQAGIDYYNNLIDELILHGIEPMVTIHHLDLPQTLLDLGGWTSEAVIRHYVDFARLAFHTFGDRVKQWITFNSPWIICWLGYSGVYAPGFYEPAETPYECAHSVLKAHALVYRMYHSEFPEQTGIIGINFDTKWYEPASSAPEDIAASERALYFKFGWFVNPLVYGDYPPIMKQLVGQKSENEGRNISRLPEFSTDDSTLIRGSWDFIGLTHYTAQLVSNSQGGTPGWSGDQDNRQFPDSSWPVSGSSWLYVVPWGFRSLLNWIKDTYGNPRVIITENGVSDIYDSLNPLNDTLRIDYYIFYINELMKAVILDYCNVTAYTAWSLMDNFEWIAGFTERFGVYHVDFNSSEKTRTPKASAEHLSRIFLDNGFPKRRRSDRESAMNSSLKFVYISIGIVTIAFVASFVWKNTRSNLMSK